MRQVIARAVHWVGLRSGHALRLAQQVHKPRILMYHAIDAHETSPELFVWQLELLRQEFEIVSLTELLSRIDRSAANGSEVVITFDDGVRNHVTAAYPLLRDMGVPATFFVCPGRWVWNMELRLRLNLLTDYERFRLARSWGFPDSGTESLIDWSKRLDLGERQQLEAQVQSQTREFDPSPVQVDRYAPMSWAEVTSMDPNIITLGSHSVSHPMLTTLPDDQRRAEIAGSRSLLEERIGRKTDVFCYPNGDNDERTLGMVRECYSAAVTARSGFVDPDQGVYLLPRIPAAERPDLFVRRLHHPGA